MDSRLHYLILKNTARLEKLIESEAPYEKILKQRQKLDKLIMIAMKDVNRKARDILLSLAFILSFGSNYLYFTLYFYISYFSINLSIFPSKSSTFFSL